MKKYLKPIATVLFGVAIWLFWLFGYPEAMNYQEQNQLFLTTWAYFMERIAVVGGLADYLSEFMVQFYYVPWLGALLTGMLYAAMQWLTWKTVEKWDKTMFLLTFLVPLFMLWHQGDIDTLLSLPMAVTMTMAAAAIAGKTKLAPYYDLIVIPALYWLAGPAALAYVIIRSLDFGWRYLLPAILWYVASVMTAYWMLDYQWHLSMMFGGLNYYRIPLHAPAMQYVVMAMPVIIALAAKFNPLKNETGFTSPRSRLHVAMKAISLALVAYFAVNRGFDPFIYEMLWQDSMVRQERWDDIIKRAEKHQEDIAFSSECVNLALGVTGQLPDRMFMFKQSGTDALLQKSIRDNMSDLPTAEAFFRLGMINSALRYMFDIQQSILNARKSGRCTKRIAECYIINGNYKAADKHIELLRHTIFYRDWADNATAYLYNDAKVNGHDVWGKLRKFRYKERFLYYYPEKHKMLGLLFQNNTDNRLALAYFMGQLLLDGDFQGFMGYLQWVQQYGGYNNMPYGYADAYQCIQQQGKVPGSSYAKYVMKMMASGKNNQR